MSQHSSQPNILVLMTDQHRFDALSCRGHPHIKTPYLDALVERSVDFQATYTQAPVCAPARYSLATGQYVSTHGVHFNQINPLKPVRTIAHQMRDAGYRCLQAGHMHWSSETIDTGYESLISREMWLDSLPPEWRRRVCEEHETAFVRTEMGGSSPVPESAFWGHYLATESIRMIDEAAEKREPFFCWTSLYEPHPPLFPPKEVYERFNLNQIELPEEAPEGSTPPEPKNLYRRQKWAHLTDTEIRQMMAGYFGLVEVADRCVGRILAHLEEKGLLENTWIIWTSDHGEQLYDHELFLKFCMYEQSVHVPLCISGPGLSPLKRTELVEHIDLFPTICDLAGIPLPSGVEGRSLKALLSSDHQPESWRSSVFSQINDVYMARNGQWKLIVREGEPVELYNLAEDPKEFNNRLSDPECRDIIAELSKELKDRFSL